MLTLRRSGARGGVGTIAQSTRRPVLLATLDVPFAEDATVFAVDSHPIDALLEVVAERNPGVLVFGPDRSCLRRRTYERAVKRIREQTGCLVWTEVEPMPEDAALAMRRRGRRLLATSVLRRKR